MAVTGLPIEEFEDRAKLFQWRGRITEFHMHHTADLIATWKGARSVESIRHHHVNVRGFRDFAQHVLLDPDGKCWLGRNWNYAPASAKGHNGRDDGDRPFMIESFGDYRTDALDGAQRSSLIRIIAAVQERFALPAEAIRFHKEMGATLCPGNLDKQDLIDMVRTYRAGHYATEVQG